MAEGVKEKISLIIEAIDETKGAFVKAAKDVAGLEDASAKAAKGLDKTSDALKDAEKAYADVEKKVSAAAKETKEMADQSEKAAGSIKKVSGSLDKAANSADESAKGFEKSKKSVTSLGDAINGAVQAATSLFSAFATIGLPVIEAAQFERKMKEVAAISEATVGEFAQLEDAARKMGRETEFSAQQAAEGLKQLAAGGMNAAQAIQALPDVLNLAMTDGIELGAAAEYATTILGGMGLEVKDLNHMVDVLAQTSADSASSVTQLAEALSYAAPSARAIGMSLDQTSAALGILHNNGIKASSAGTNLRGVITALVDPTEEAKRALSGMGVEIAKNSDGSIDFYETFNRLSAKNMDLAQATQIFNKLNAGSALIFANSLDKIKESTDKNAESQGRAAQMAKDFNDSTVGAWRNMKSAAGDAAIEIGNKFMPAIVGALQGLTKFFNVISGFAKEFPMVTKAIGLATVAITGLVAIGGSAKMIMFGLSVATQGMGGAMLTMAGSVKTATIALRAMAMANPILAGITIAITAGAAAWKIFGKTSLQASEDHAETAIKIDAARVAAEKEVKTLKDLQNTLLTTKQGTAEHTAAAERLATLVPGLNASLTENGRVLGDVAEATDKNNIKLNDYIALKEKEAGIQNALQLEQLAKSYMDAGESVKGFTDNVQQWYGIGQESTTLVQDLWLNVNKLTGTYDENIKKGGELRENLEKQTAAFNAFLTKLAGSGASIEQVNAVLNNIHLDEATKEKIVSQYKLMLGELEAKAKETAEKNKQALVTSIDGTKTYTGQQIEQMKAQWDTYVNKVKTITGQIQEAQGTLNAEMRTMAQSGMADSAAWADRKKQAEEYYAAAQKAVEEANAAKAAGNTALYEQKMGEATKAANDSKEAYKSLNTEVKDNGQIVITHQEGLKTAMEGVNRAGELLINTMKNQRQEAIDGAKALEKEVGLENLTKGVDDLKVKWSTSWLEMGSSANEQLSPIEITLDRMLEKGRQWATIWQQGGKTATVTGENTSSNGASGAPGVSGYAHGGFLRRQGKLPGWGGGDRIRAMLEPGEYIIRKEAVRKYGADLMHKINTMGLGAGTIIKARVGGIVPSIAPIAPIKMQSGGQVPGGQGATRVVELKFKGGSLYGSGNSVNSLLYELENAGLST